MEIPKEVEELIDEATKSGAIFATLYLEAQGNDASLVKGALVNVTKKITKFPGVLYGIGEIEKVAELGDGIFSSFSEIKVLCKDLKTLFSLVLNFAPSGIEIEKPEKFEIDAGELQEILSEVSGTINTFAEHVLKGMAEKGMIKAIRKSIEEAKEEVKRIESKTE